LGLAADDCKMGRKFRQVEERNASILVRKKFSFTVQEIDNYHDLHMCLCTYCLMRHEAVVNDSSSESKVVGSNLPRDIRCWEFNILRCGHLHSFCAENTQKCLPR
jgi:hypothetical protein